MSSSEHRSDERENADAIVRGFAVAAEGIITSFRSAPRTRTEQGNAIVAQAQRNTNERLGQLVLETVRSLPADMDSDARLAVIRQFAPSIDDIANRLELPYYFFGREAMAIALEGSTITGPPPTVDNWIARFRRAFTEEFPAMLGLNRVPPSRR